MVSLDLNESFGLHFPIMRPSSGRTWNYFFLNSNERGTRRTAECVKDSSSLNWNIQDFYLLVHKIWDMSFAEKTYIVSIIKKFILITFNNYHNLSWDYRTSLLKQSKSRRFFVEKYTFLLIEKKWMNDCLYSLPLNFSGYWKQFCTRNRRQLKLLFKLKMNCQIFFNICPNSISSPDLYKFEIAV